MSGGFLWGASWLHLHHRLHSGGIRPAPVLGWVSGGGALGLAGFIFNYARRIRVIIIEPSPMIEPEPDKTPLKAVVKPAEENQVILTRSKTKAMAQQV